ncbi:TraB/GumN family protein [Candidatus Woesearchaeota archaeon]|nr:TraB/GumN family protein [Candidatus Woesearchaeota archaeon]
MNNLKIIGTSHIAKQSIEEIKKAVEEFQPEIMAVELDRQRAIALMQKQKNKMSFRDIAKIGVKGYAFVKIGHYVQQKLGKIVGVAPGSEMKTALEIANTKKLRVAFIDQPINITLKNFSKELTWKEKGTFALDLVKGIFSPKKQMKKYGLEEFDLRKVPEQQAIAKIVSHVKKQYPSIYKTIIADRDKYMVKQLVRLLRQHPEKKILAVVGAGHKEGMEKLLLKVDIIR